MIEQPFRVNTLTNNCRTRSMYWCTFRKRAGSYNNDDSEASQPYNPSNNLLYASLSARKSWSLEAKCASPLPALVMASTKMSSSSKATSRRTPASLAASTASLRCDAQPWRRATISRCFPSRAVASSCTTVIKDSKLLTDASEVWSKFFSRSAVPAFFLIIFLDSSPPSMSLKWRACCKAQMHNFVRKLISRQMLRKAPGLLIWPPPRPALRSFPCSTQPMDEMLSSCASTRAMAVSPRSGRPDGLDQRSCESLCNCLAYNASSAAGTIADKSSGALQTGNPEARQMARRVLHQPKSCGTLAAKRWLIQRGQSKAGNCESLSATGARHTGISRKAVWCLMWRWSTQKLGDVPRSSPVPSCEQSTTQAAPSRRRTSCKRFSIHCAMAFSDFPATKLASTRTTKLVAPACPSCSAMRCSRSARIASPSAGSKPPKQTQASSKDGAKRPQNAREGRARSKQRCT
mmetsp:Transcript_127844/g.368146  ORF Transcript_127844/g.368146 Transcript_127844/m.368146 type:complete len:461 (-) Transcript_127844:4868-6250(-)